MNKQLLLGILLSVSGIMQGMESDDKFLSVRMGGYSVYGRREYQEDRFVCGVIEHNDDKFYCTVVADGHGDEKVASLLQARFLTFVQDGLNDQKSVKKSLKHAASKCEALALENEDYGGSGSTLLASCFNKKDKQLNVLWVGDSRAAFEGKDFYTTSDHKPTEESEKYRIAQAGGIIKSGRLNGVIGVSRSIGDKIGKDLVKALIFKPEFAQTSILSNGFYIGASDGFWDEVKEEEITGLLVNALCLSGENFYQRYCSNFNDFVKNFTSEDTDASDMSFSEDLNNHSIEFNNTFEKASVTEIAKKLVHVALCRGSKDNITVVVKLFSESCNDESYLSSSNDLDSCDDITDCLEELHMFNSKDDALVQTDYSFKADGSGSEKGEVGFTSDDTKGNNSIDLEELPSDEYQMNAQSEKVESQKNEDIETLVAQVPTITVISVGDGEDVTDEASTKKVTSDDTKKSVLLYWKLFIQNHKYKIGGLATILAIIVTAYKYNYLHLNYMMA